MQYKGFGHQGFTGTLTMIDPDHRERGRLFCRKQLSLCSEPQHNFDALDSFDDYIMISTSAVYSLEGRQPFAEEAELGRNPYWGPYSTGKIAAEKALLARVPDANILRPPYIYGPMNSLYREPFVFDCARADRKFYLPGDGSQKLQFFYIDDL